MQKMKRGRVWVGGWSVEWVVGGQNLTPGMTFSVDNIDKKATLFIGIWPLLWLFVSRDIRGSRYESFDDARREIGWNFHDGILWIELWSNPDAWPRRNATLHVVDLLLGKNHITRRVNEESVVSVPMPEGCYQALVTSYTVTHKRPRWVGRQWCQYEFCFANGAGIPIPGKGENSWDLDDTAIESIVVTAQTLHDAIGRVVSSAMRDRIKYGGGVDWLPANEKG